MTDLTGQSLGRYHILEQLGEGGMATVFKAFDVSLDNEVAIKFIRTEKLTIETMARSLKRFEREAKALAQLTHPNIVSVIDYGEYEGRPYLVMPYLRGGTLKQKMGKPMPYRQAAEILLPIARALSYAHQHQVLHRDVKPSNILLTDSGQPMLGDFGIAKILEDELTHDLTGTGVGVGTPEYMAPEQGMSKEIDHRVDIYSLGTVFYELVTGRKPYEADTPLAIMLKRASEPLPSPRGIVRDLPPEVERVLLKALARDREQRYPDATSFATALESIVRIPEASGRAQPGLTPMLRKYWLVALGILVCVALIAASALVIGSMMNNDSSTTPPTKTEQVEATRLPTQTREVVTEVFIPTAFEPDPTNTILPPTTELIPVGDVGRDGMVLVHIPEGAFTMGSNGGDSDEQPPHTVHLDAFWIDQTEVTNAMFAEFLNEMGNQSEGGVTWITYPDNDVQVTYIQASWTAMNGFENHPVVEVSWYGANAYCQWVNRRLPTEAEWEKSARGEGGATLPWEGSLDCNRANFGGCVGHSTAVGSYSSGESPYGVLDMFGNVWEWVYDQYDTDYYKRSPASNPTGPLDGRHHILRGTGWDTTDQKRLRITFRYNRAPNLTSSSYGFRCATSSP